MIFQTFLVFPQPLSNLFIINAFLDSNVTDYSHLCVINSKTYAKYGLRVKQKTVFHRQRERLNRALSSNMNSSGKKCTGFYNLDELQSCRSERHPRQ